MNPSEKQIFCFADVELDTSRGCLKRNGDEQHLRQKTFQVLVYLLEQNERLVTKEELIENIWKETAVTDDTLAQCVKDIRRALGDDPRQPRFIKTVPKFGYRFIGPVTRRIAESSLPAFIETEEVTSVKVEYEEDTDDAVTRRRGDAAIKSLLAGVTVSRLLPRVAASPRHRVAAASALALVLVTALGLSIYFRQRLFPSRQNLTEATLPHIPGKKPIAVMFFENQSNSVDLDWLHEGLADMLITDLSRSAKLIVLNRQQLHLLLERVGHKQGEQIQLNEALDITRKARAEAVVLGSFARLGEKVRIDVQLHDARSGQLLAAETMNVDKVDQILTQVDLLALKLTTHLGAAPTEQEKKAGLADVMTSSLEAYRYYSLALERAHAFRSGEAIQLLEKAIALDPQFAMAYARIGYVYTVSGGFDSEFEKGKRYLEKAFQLGHRLTERDRLYITAWYTIANGDSAGSIRLLREVIKQYPYDVESYYRLSYTLRNEARLQEAIEVIQQGLLIDPEAADLYNRLGFCYSELGRHDEALAAHQRYIQLAPKQANAYDSLGMTYNEMGRYQDALTAFDKALALEPDSYLAMMHTGDVYFLLGRYRAAAEQYQRCLPLTAASYHRATEYRRLVWLYLRKGDLQRAERAAQQGLRNLDGLAAFLVALAREDTKTAERLKFEFLDSPGGRPRLAIEDKLKNYYQGLLALKSGRAAEAIEDFKEALRHPPLVFNVDGFEDCLANAYLELGRLDEAITEYGRILRLNPNYPLLHYHLAQAYERKGQREQARGEYQRFLEIWKDADVDIPEVIAAKKQLTTQS